MNEIELEFGYFHWACKFITLPQWMVDDEEFTYTYINNVFGVFHHTFLNLFSWFYRFFFVCTWNTDMMSSYSTKQSFGLSIFSSTPSLSICLLFSFQLISKCQLKLISIAIILQVVDSTDICEISFLLSKYINLPKPPFMINIKQRLYPLSCLVSFVQFYSFAKRSNEDQKQKKNWKHEHSIKILCCKI